MNKIVVQDFVPKVGEDYFYYSPNIGIPIKVNWKGLEEDWQNFANVKLYRTNEECLKDNVRN